MALAAQDLAEALDDLVWSLPAEHFVGVEPAFAGFFRAARLSLREVLVYLADESLALCLQKRFCHRHAFEELLVNRYEPALERYFARRIVDKGTASDLVQEFYVKLLENATIDRYDTNLPFLPWFWQVVRHFLTDTQRRRRFVGEPLEELSSGELGPFELAAFAEFNGQVEEALARLPDLQQKILRGTMEGRGHGELAQTLGIPLSHVYRHLFHARRTVERLLARPSI